VLFAVPPPHGQYGLRLGPPARMRVRPVHDGRALALSIDRVPEPAAGLSGIPRPEDADAAGAERLEEGVLPIPPADHLQGPAPARAQVAAAHLPDRDTAGDVPGGPLRPHCPRSVRGLSIHDPSVEIAAHAPR